MIVPTEQNRAACVVHRGKCLGSTSDSQHPGQAQISGLKVSHPANPASFQ